MEFDWSERDANHRQNVRSFLDEALPADWEEFTDESSGKKYYFSEKTGETVWERPEGFQAQAQQSEEKPAQKEKEQPEESDEAFYQRTLAAQQAKTLDTESFIEGIRVLFVGRTKFLLQLNIFLPPKSRFHFANLAPIKHHLQSRCGLLCAM